MKTDVLAPLAFFLLLFAGYCGYASLEAAGAYEDRKSARMMVAAGVLAVAAVGVGCGAAL